MLKSNLPQKIKDKIESFIAALENTYQEGLVSVILYGSAASGEFAGESSDLNILVVLNDCSLNNLSKISKTINNPKFSKFNLLFLTQDYIRRSIDVFPIEFLDMKENYAVLCGDDVLKDLNIDIKNLRFQCEQELKAKILNIKNIYLRNRNKVVLQNLLFKSFNSSLHILRNLVRLKGIKPLYLKEDVLKQVSKEFPLDTANFNKILEVKKRNLKFSYKEAEDLLFSFSADLEKIINLVDKFDV